ncbi:3-hydroxyacyl-CoA dehydrogenase family protein [Halorubrum sp. JWXQ-INN 858]|uniref:3-hydroxyacyl-CoA dehydrogenase family protein n=1 Tax=Halorubrum sp. JWXQ-INN 858 TaxID=2690782 RepID=UPI00135AB491|nr:3-hydroxyacyl-CoA dehydrogenase NAD-binding domain-containing protein [Halorubrum sp. JWXQ-INN 858]MWV65585.1 3-hydroxyacyl-CoA dehydrogenase family protein [Halorubrum sp. JWXQ-INN 858]
MEQNVSVIGAGNMGQGFGVHFAVHGHDVTLVDHRDSNLERAADRMADAAAELRDGGIADVTPETVLDRVTFTTDQAAGVADADVVLETVPEDLGIKREVFTALGEHAPDDAVLASNTSGIPITEIQSAVPDCADRVVGCHWWFPPYLLEPVEIVRGERTSDRTMDRIRAFVEDVERRPITVEKDVPGFVWNRIQNAVIRECLHLLEEDVASIEDINAAVRDGYARRTSVIGPFETMDIAGVEQFRTVAEHLYPHLCSATEVHGTFDDRLAEGATGIDAGRGFLEYDEPEAEIVARRDRRLAALRRCFESFEE